MLSRIKSNSGVTLMELMIISVIIGIVASMAVPRFQIAMDRMRISSTGREITSVIRVARSTAIAEKNDYGLFFDDVSKTVTMFKDIANPGGQSFDPTDSIARVDTLPSEFTWIGTDCTNDVVIFQPNGSADFGGGGNIWTLASTDNVVGMTSSQILASTGKVSSTISVY